MKRLLIAAALALCLPLAAAASTTATHAVHIRNFAYSPSQIQIKVGDSVEFINDDDEAHTVTATDKSFDSAGLDTGDRWSYRFKKPGRYAYLCALHPWMKGVIVVTAGSSKR